MKKHWKDIAWFLGTIGGSAIFALGFSMFLEPYGMSPGGISGLAMVLVHLLKVGSVGTLSILINLPLFLLGGLKIGKRFFAGSLIGMLLSSVLIDLFAGLPIPEVEPLVGVLYGGGLCGLGLGLVFVIGSSTGGSDILVRLLKLRWRNVPIGQIALYFDIFVVILTGIVYRDITSALYTGLAVFVTSQVVDMVVYRFDFSKVALIITKEHERVAREISDKLERGATFLYGEGSYSGRQTKVVLTAVKKQQLAELKELVVHNDPNAFIIVQEAHQVLGDGFSRYTKDSL